MSRALDRIFKVATGLCAIGSCALFLGIAGTILFKGCRLWTGGFSCRAPMSSLARGVSSTTILGTIILIAYCLGRKRTACGRTLFGPDHISGVRAAKRRLRLAIYTANGVPSILFGIFGLIVFGSFLGWGKSWLAGGIVLGAMILPTLTVALVERIEALPRKYITAAAASGLSQPQIIRSVILPQTRGGLLVGALLGLARAAGETAPIMFTAAVFSGATLPSGIRESPVLALPYHVFVLAQDSFAPAANTQMWGAAVVLLGLVLLLSLMALPARLRSAEEARHG